MDEDLAPVCQRLNLSVYQAMQMYEKFKEIDQDMSGVIDLEEFFEHLSEEKTPFATQLFTLIDENASGELDFNEFLVGLWNICTFEEESLLRFAFDLVDTDGSGYVDGDEMEGMIKNLHGTKYNKNLFIHTKKVLKQYDTNGDNQFSFDEFKKCHKKLPLLFMPAFGLMRKLQDEFYGHDFWKSAARARKRDRKAQKVRDFMALNAEIQKIAPDKYTGQQMANAVFREQQRRKSKVHQASFDTNKMRVDEFDPAKERRLSYGDKLRKEHNKHESSGIKAFSLDKATRLGVDDDKPAVREDRKRGFFGSVAKVVPAKPSVYDEEVTIEVQTLRLEANQARAGPRSARSEGPRSARSEGPRSARSAGPRSVRSEKGGRDPLEKNFLSSTKPAKAMLGDGKRVANPLRRKSKGSHRSSRRASAQYEVSNMSTTGENTNSLSVWE